MPKLNLVATSSETKTVAALAQSLRDSATADRGGKTPWKQFRAGMAMCIGG